MTSESLVLYVLLFPSFFSAYFAAVPCACRAYLSPVMEWKLVWKPDIKVDQINPWAGAYVILGPTLGIYMQILSYYQVCC